MGGRPAHDAPFRPLLRPTWKAQAGRRVGIRLRENECLGTLKLDLYKGHRPISTVHDSRARCRRVEFRQNGLAAPHPQEWWNET
jgi:hypothetical protein